MSRLYTIVEKVRQEYLVSLVAAQCHFEFLSTYSTQLFSSPNYPKSYPDQTKCTWLVRAHDLGQVELTFVEISTEEYYDFVEVFDGETEENALLLRFSGKSKLSSATFISSSGSLFIKFTSDRSVGERGFKASYRTALPLQVNITTVIQSQLAETSIVYHVINRDNVTREVPFHMLLPITAYVTSFEMTSRGISYKGSLEIKRGSYQKYEEASVRTITQPYLNDLKVSLRRFTASINVPAGESVTYRLQYQELLELLRHRYNYKVFTTKRQLFGNIRLDIYLCAKSEVNYTRLLPIGISRARASHHPSNFLPKGFNMTVKRNFVHVSYRPPAIRATAPHGGTFELQYKVRRHERPGKLYLHGSYFVQDFMPVLPHIRRRIVFVLDISGSMAGNKVNQVRKAINNILQDLDNKVLLNIVLFESVVRVWQTKWGLVPLTAKNKLSAMRFMTSLNPDGGSNLDDALRTGLKLLKKDAAPTQRPSRTFIHPTTDYIILLTDGKPTIGVRSPSAILRRVGRANRAGYGVYSIGFGQNVDMNFLKELSSRNGGAWRQIFDDAHSDEQIKNYIATLGAPLLTDLSIKYSAGIANETTSLNHVVLRNGEEILVAGVLSQSANLSHGDILPITVTGHSDAGQGVKNYNLFVQNATICSEMDGIRKLTKVTERIYALLRIKELNLRMEREKSEAERRWYRKEMLLLTMRYGFVTRVAAMVVNAVPATNPSPLPTEAQPLVEARLLDPTEVVSIASLTPPDPTLLSPPQPIPTQTSRREGKLSMPWILQGDPHFIVELHQGLRACFTWGGTPGKNYNLLEDFDNNITVHGLVAKAPSRPSKGKNKHMCDDKLPQTYFSQFAFHYKKIAFVVTPHNVTVYNSSDGKQIRMSFLCASDEEIALEGPLTRIRIYDISRTHSMINVTFKGLLTFIVNLHRVRDRPLLHQMNPMGDHLDLVVEGAERLSSRSEGLFGGFLADTLQRDFKKATIIDENDQPVLKYGNHRFEATMTDMVNPIVPRGTLGCYFLCNADVFLGKNNSAYYVQSLLRKEFQQISDTKGRINYVT